jgi:lipopolysaccharide heptosyltransferase I
VSEPGRILIIRPSALGDVCRSAPVLASLRRAYPRAEIDWLVQDTFAPAVEHHAALSGVVKFPRAGLGRDLKRGRIGAVVRWLRGLRGRRYDLALDCQGLARSGFFAWASGAARRVGYANARELGWVWLNERHRVDPKMHAVDRMLELVRAMGIEPVCDLRLYTAWQDRAWVERDPALAGGFVVMAPTSRWPGKRWPVERFAAVARALTARGERVVVVGAASERGQCGPLLELAKETSLVVDRVGGTSVGQLMALVEASRLVIANDSAALHMAVGFDRPIVALFGPTRVELVGPYGRERDVIQHLRRGDRVDHKDEASGRGLMERISVEEVVAAADKISRREGVGQEPSRHSV